MLGQENCKVNMTSHFTIHVGSTRSPTPIVREYHIKYEWIPGEHLHELGEYYRVRMETERVRG